MCKLRRLTPGDPMDYTLPSSSMRFPKQEYWNGLPFPPEEDLPNLGIESTSLVSVALALHFYCLKKKKKSLTINWQGRPATNLRFARSMVSVKCNRGKDSKSRWYACTVHAVSGHWDWAAWQRCLPDKGKSQEELATVCSPLSTHTWIFHSSINSTTIFIELYPSILSKRCQTTWLKLA